MKDMILLASDIPVEWYTQKENPGSVGIIKMNHNHCNDDTPQTPRYPCHEHYILSISGSRDEIQINLENVITCIKLFCPELLNRKKY